MHFCSVFTDEPEVLICNKSYTNAVSCRAACQLLFVYLLMYRGIGHTSVTCLDKLTHTRKVSLHLLATCCVVSIILPFQKSRHCILMVTCAYV